MHPYSSARRRPRNGITAMVAQMQHAQDSRPRGEALRDLIIRQARTGTSQREIAHALGVSRTYVFGVLRDARERHAAPGYLAAHPIGN